MNKKGFTLVELLAVIVILSVILGMVVINSKYFSDKRKQQDYDNLVNIVLENTKTMVETSYTMSDSIDSVLGDSSNASHKCKLGYSVLVSNNLMDNDIKNPKTGDSLSNSCVLVSFDTNNEYQYKYEFLEECTAMPNCLTN